MYKWTGYYRKDGEYETEILASKTKVRRTFVSVVNEVKKRREEEGWKLTWEWLRRR